jgi:hypothetical protein
VNDDEEWNDEDLFCVQEKVESGHKKRRKRKKRRGRT